VKVFFSTKLLRAYFQYLLYWNLNLIGFKFNSHSMYLNQISEFELNSIQVACNAVILFQFCDVAIVGNHP
jgi:hypothetical protein